MRAGARTTRVLSSVGLVSILLAAAIAFGPATAAQEATPAWTPASAPVPSDQSSPRAPTTIAPGLTYQKITDKSIPLRTYVLRFDPSQSSMLDVAKGGSSMPGSMPTARMLKAHQAIAGVNGDFLSFNRGSPLHAFAEDGDLLQTTTQLKGMTDRVLGIGAQGMPMHVGETTTEINVHDVAGGKTWPVTHWNAGGPYSGYHLSANEVDGFTAYGGALVLPPKNACSVRLINATGPRWSDADKTGITRSYTVDQVVCSAERMPLNGGIVLSAQLTGTGADRINALLPGGSVDVTWGMQGWNGVTDVIGGNPLIVDNGLNTVDPACSTYVCQRNARTGIGITSDGTVLIVVVDGRVTSSFGVTLYDFANLMKGLGAVNVVNLDGDGSSTMWINGQTMNKPGDARRRVSSALAVIASPDPGEHIGPAT